ncbi:MAG: tetratricopeptide repeat protein [Planctomycetaceae bacterium]|nr:tetratricopeptide repeat protein [Planctomycetaceae bacterium]
MRADSRSDRRWTGLAVLILLSLPANGFGQQDQPSPADAESQAADAHPADGNGANQSGSLVTSLNHGTVQLQITDVRISEYAVANRESRANLAISLQLKNTSDAEVAFRRDQLELYSGDTNLPARISLADLSTNLTNRPIPPGESLSGILHFSGLEISDGEPPLELVYQSESGEEPVRIDIGRAFRDLVGLQARRIGPELPLGVITIRRDLDEVSAWVLLPALQGLQQNGCETIVIGRRAGTTGLTVSESILQWLSHLSGSQPPGLPKNGLRTDLQFRAIVLGGFSRPAEFRYRQQKTESIEIQGDTDNAIAEILVPRFDQMDPVDAFQYFHDPEAGVRLAAVRTTVDRLYPDQKHQLCETFDQFPVNTRIEILKAFAVSADAEIVRLLGRECLNENRQISSAAMSSLARCAIPESEQAMLEVWKACQSHEQSLNRLIGVLLYSRDVRWSGLLARWEINTIRRMAAEDAESHRELLTDDQGLIPNGFQPAIVNSPSQISTSSLASQMKRVAHEVMAAGDPSIVDEARMACLKTADPAVQEVLAGIIQDDNNPADRNLLVQYAKQRIVRRDFNEMALRIIQQYPDPEVTRMIMDQIGEGGRGPQAVLAELRLMQSVVRTLTADQCDQLISLFDQLNTEIKSALLRHLVDIHHPQRYQIATQCMKETGRLSNTTYEILADDASEDSIALLVERLEVLTSRSEQLNESQMHMQSFDLDNLLGRLAEFRHPTCLGALNRCTRGTQGDVRSRLDEAARNVIFQSPAFPLVLQMFNARRADEYEEVIDRASRAIEADPFLWLPYLYRGSERMRKGEMDEAMADLRRADDLNPEHLPVLSTIALLTVRLGHVAAGLTEAERLLKEDPEDHSNLYNTACVYARAAEQVAEDSPDHNAHLSRCMELLTQSVDHGFTDLEHIQTDYDLTILAGRPDYQTLLKRIEVLQKEESDGDDKE